MNLQHITSRQNLRVKNAASLRTSRHRRQQQLFLIDGIREIDRALDARVSLAGAFVCESLAATPECQRVVQLLVDAGANIATVTRPVFEKLSYGDRSDGIVVVARYPERSLENIRLPEKPLIAVLEGIEKPGNVGAILRSADGAAVDAVVVAEGGTDLMNPNTIRASLGTVFAPNVCSATVM